MFSIKRKFKNSWSWCLLHLACPGIHFFVWQGLWFINALPICCASWWIRHSQKSSWLINMSHCWWEKKEEPLGLQIGWKLYITGPEGNRQHNLRIFRSRDICGMFASSRGKKDNSQDHQAMSPSCLGWGASGHYVLMLKMTNFFVYMIQELWNQHLDSAASVASWVHELDMQRRLIFTLWTIEGCPLSSVVLLLLYHPT